MTPKQVQIPRETYGSLVRQAMRRKGLSRRDVTKRIEDIAARDGRESGGYSYEHIRKIVAGLPLMSEQFNDDICRVLELDAGVMWAVATREKIAFYKRQHPGASGPSVIPDSRLKDVWGELLPSDHEQIIKIATGMAEQRRLQRQPSDRSIEELREDMQRLMEQISEKMQSSSSESESRRSGRR